jgi:hypothetical protein
MPSGFGRADLADSADEMAVCAFIKGDVLVFGRD